MQWGIYGDKSASHFKGRHAAVTLVTGPICLAMGYLSLYTQNDFVKGFFAGTELFKFQFWGVFSSIALIGLSIVDFLAKTGSADPLVVFITA